MPSNAGLDTFVKEIRQFDVALPEDELARLAEHARQAYSCMQELGSALSSWGVSSERIKTLFIWLQPQIDSPASDAVKASPKAIQLPPMKSALKRSKEPKSAMQGTSPTNSDALDTVGGSCACMNGQLEPTAPPAPKKSALRRPSVPSCIVEPNAAGGPASLTESSRKRRLSAPAVVVPCDDGQCADTPSKATASNAKPEREADEAGELLALAGSKAARSKLATQPEEGPDHVLAELLTAKKVDVGSVRQKLEQLDIQGEQLDLDASVSPSRGLPPPLFYAVGIKSAGLASLMLTFKADVRKRYAGKRWQGIMRGMTPLEATVNLKEHFHGTILAASYMAIEEVLLKGEQDYRVAQSRRQNTLRGAARMIGLRRSKTTEERDREKQSVQEAEVISLEEAAELETRAEAQLPLSERSTSLLPRPSVVSIGGYDVLSRVIGVGTFSTTFVWQHKASGELRAVKVVPEKLVDDSWLWAEVDLLRSMEHPNIAKFLEHFDHGGCVHVVIEYCDGGDLLSALIEPGSGYVEAIAARMARQMLGAVQYLHSRSICHRDLKPENFLLSQKSSLSSMTLKLIDFGTARIFQDTDVMTTKIYSLPYVAPEVLGPVGTSYTESCDVWSLGVIMYLILSGCSPFAGSSDLQILKQIKDGKYVFEPADTWATVSTSAKEIIREMLNVDAAERQSAEKVLEHPWILQEAAAAPGAGQSGMHKQIMSTLHSFTAMQRLKRFSVQIFERHLNEDAENSLTAAFLELDTERHGLLQIDHVEAVVLHSRCPHETKLQLRHVLYSTAGGCDKVDYNGMIAAMRRSKEQLQTKALRSAFDVLVVESDGMATVKGLMAMLPREVPLKPGVSMQLQDVLGLKTVDIDRIALQLKLTGNDPVKCDEFIGMWRAVPELASAESS